MNKYIKNAQFKTTQEAFDDGKACGLTWDRPWVPGGPFSHSIGPCEREEEWIEYCVHTQKCRRQWCRGWEAGRREAERKEAQ